MVAACGRCGSLSFTGTLRAQFSRGTTAPATSHWESITINVPPGGTASDQTFVVKSTSGAEQPIRIGSPAGESEPLTVDRRDLTFRVQPGGSSQATLSVLSPSGTTTTFAASVTSPATAWLTVTPAATSMSTGTSNLTVRVDSLDLAEGT